MSDDLISRKAFIEYMNKNFERTPQVVTFIGIIAEQPVAFDKEKVIEKLQRHSHNYYPSIDHYCLSRKAVDLKDAIEIVEKGGIE